MNRKYKHLGATNSSFTQGEVYQVKGHEVLDDDGIWVEGINPGEKPETWQLVSPHPHESKIFQYTEDSARMDNPWTLWTYRHKISGRESPCTKEPSWHPDYEYRREDPTETKRVGKTVYHIDNQAGFTYVLDVDKCYEITIKEVYQDDNH